MNIVVQISAEDYTFTKDRASWSTAEDDLAILKVTRTALLNHNAIRIKSQLVTLAVHIQPVGTPRNKILGPFLSEPLKRLSAERTVSSFGNHIKFLDSDILLDFSAAIANGIFIRSNSYFDGTETLETVFQTVRNNQKEVFDILEVEEEIEHA